MKSASNKPKIIVVCGPTAVGKTSVTIGLARRFDGEIINADSRQIYRHMDIGTAKPTVEERAAIPHHLVDFVEPGESFDARKFGALARQKAAELIARNKLPFVVGGTGLYIKSMLHGLFEAKESSPEIRARLKREAEEHGPRLLYERLEKADPETASRLHPNDVYRVARALEIYEITGKPASRLHREHGFSERKYDSLKIGLYMDRQILYERIDRRVDSMVSNGFLEEVRQLTDQGFSPSLKSMKTIGYGHMLEFLENKLSWPEALELLKRDTRRYAKRQMTWFRADPEIVWRKPSQTDSLVPLIEEFLKNGR